MAKKIDTLPAERLTQDLLNERVDINALNLEKKTHREAFLEAVRQRHGLLKKIKTENAPHFLNYLISERPDYFVYIKKEHYANNLVQMYLENRLANTENTQQNPKKPLLQTAKTYNDHLSFTYLYATTEDDELYYHDHELGIPVALRASLKAVLKLTDGMKLLEKIDVNVSEIGENRICGIIHDIILAQYKETLLTYVNENKTGYYSMCAHCSELEKMITNALSSKFNEYGFEVTQFTIKKMAIPKDIQHKVEDLAFQLRQQRVNLEAETEFAKKSIENYEAKLAVQQKYPTAEQSLTEYEKDLALKRYMIKTGRLSEETVDHSIKLQTKAEAVDEAVKKDKDDLPDIVPKKNIFKRNFIVCAVLAVFISLIVMLSGSVAAGFIMLGLTVAIGGVVFAFNREKILAPKIESNYSDNDKEDE